MHRRNFLRVVAATGAAANLGAGWWSRVLAEPVGPGTGPYGPLQAPDALGLRLPVGFTGRVVAVSGVPVTGAGEFVWPGAPDGAATFPTDDGGWVLAVNSEVGGPGGGVAALRFDPAGEVADGYRLLEGTARNCAGGATPWGTWLSCEEVRNGLVHECDPSGPGQGTARPALGAFAHEAVAVDPVGHRLYLSEDRGAGNFWRFTPTAWRDDGVGVLDDGVLEVAALGAGGRTVEWVAPGDPSGSAFDGGEGVWFHDGVVFLVTKGDGRIRAFDVATGTVEVRYDRAPVGPEPRSPLGLDTLVVSAAGELFIAEDSGRRLRLAMIDPAVDGPVVSPFLELIEPRNGSEITGPTFSPAGDRLYVSSQRGGSLGQGITYEITGPFAAIAAAATTSTTTVATTSSTITAPTPTATGDSGPGAAGREGTTAPTTGDGDSQDVSGPGIAAVVAATAVGGVAAAHVARRRRAAAEPGETPPDHVGP